MSYDLLIFEPDSATDEDFPRWWKQAVARWDEPHDFNTIVGATPAIRSIYRDLIRAFPPINGPDALSEEELEEREAEGLPVADYTIGVDYIYISVGWSDANALVKTVGQMAWTQRLAVAYVSEDSSIFRP
ncbi:hypothetical protein BKH31_10995 [Actinomyces oris]|uniref:Uncharacterized protein n=1 Tax=Actinomyces oris TaxID=544580 RepID=A0A1Q8V8B7_9ACTO|nr:hypothetical protein [Actinomyces oris]OLO44352.1 hypothetical protein BKH31_10995 [Actinomyces oris]